MKKVVKQINAAGLKAGVHTMSGNIVKTDSCKRRHFISLSILVWSRLPPQAHQTSVAV